MFYSRNLLIALNVLFLCSSGFAGSGCQSNKDGNYDCFGNALFSNKGTMFGQAAQCIIDAQKAMNKAAEAGAVALGREIDSLATPSERELIGRVKWYARPNGSVNCRLWKTGRESYVPAESIDEADSCSCSGSFSYVLKNLP